MSFVHLHVHTQYSLLDGASDISKLLDKAKSEGATSVAITDHGVMYGVINFYNEAKKRGIKPLIGCEVYTAPRSRFDKVHGIDSDYGHLVLIAKNNEGYKNLMALVSYGFTEGYYYKPRVDFELLKKYSGGLIALSGCLRGDVARKLSIGDFDGAVAMAQKYADIFGKEDFYIEIQNHGIDAEIKIIDDLCSVAQKCGLKTVATNDVHYVNKQDAFLQDVLTCIQTGKKLSDTDRLKFETDEFYFKSENEMRELFAKYPDSIDQSGEIAKKCNVELDFNTVHLPKAQIESPLTHSEYLKNLCIDGAKQKYGDVTDKLMERINYELDTITKMGYTDYFLIVWDFIRYAKSNDIMVGPGRGSAAGSIVAYCLDITEIDPIKYDLIFERFLNPERVSMPDIDIDFCYKRRDEVKDYVVNKYGKDRVAQIVTFGTLAARAAIRDVGRVMDIESYVVDKVAKSVPEVLHIKLKDAISQNAELGKMYNTDMQIKRLLDTAMALEGFPRNCSTHAAGIVIADGPLNNYVPLQDGENGIVTQYPMDNLESLGMLKMDFLGLRNLTIIQDTIRLVEKNRGIKIDLKNFDYEDSDTFNMLMSGDTDGVFQLENPGLQLFMQKFRPKCIEDIIITTSIYRPGPMDQIPEFLKNVKNPEKIKYIHPKLEPILKSTYGAIIYQEQVMEIVRSLAGYSLGRADLVRRAMAKKKHSVMENERQVFVYGQTENGKIIVPGAVRLGIEPEKANEIFDYLTDFANYAFNKSHAACYATVAYQTAYLKRHYPVEYLVSLLMSLMGNSYKTNKYLRSFAKYGIKLVPPDVNKSFAVFSAEGTDIRYGLSAIKNVGMQFPDDIARERQKNGEFTSFSDFITRMARYDTNKRTVETLIKTGVFDSLCSNRKALIISYDKMMDIAASDAKLSMSGQVSLFDSDIAQPAVTDKLICESVADYTTAQKLAFEKEFAGMYISSHPLDDYIAKVKAFSDTNIFKIYEQHPTTRVRLCGIISEIRKKRTKSGITIVTMTFTDFYSDIELVAFEKTYSSYSAYIVEGAAVYIEATVNNRGEGKISLNLNSMIPLSSLGIPTDKKLYVRVESKIQIGDVICITQKYCGDTPICIYAKDTGVLYTGDSSKNVNLSNELIKELTDKFDDENIKIN